jgi:hypothetical protein
MKTTRQIALLAPVTFSSLAACAGPAKAVLAHAGSSIRPGV